jgi:hypothetical protein
MTDRLSLSKLLDVICHPDADELVLALALEAAKGHWRYGYFTLKAIEEWINPRLRVRSFARGELVALVDSPRPHGVALGDENGMTWVSTEYCA